MTFVTMQKEIQKTVGSTDSRTLDHIKEAINLAYRELCGVSPLFWAKEQKLLAVSAGTQDYDLDADCRQVLGIRSPTDQAFKITMVDNETWDEFITDWDTTGQPVLAKVEDRGSSNEMHVYFHPIPTTAYAGSYPYDAMLRPSDLSADDDTPIFGSEWDTTLIAMARAELVKILGESEQKIQVAEGIAATQLDRFISAHQRGADAKGA